MTGSAMREGDWLCVENRLARKLFHLLGDSPASVEEGRWADQIGGWMHLFIVEAGRSQGVKET